MFVCEKIVFNSSIYKLTIGNAFSPIPYDISMHCFEEIFDKSIFGRGFPYVVLVNKNANLRILYLSFFV